MTHGLPYDHIQACNVYTDGAAIFLLEDVCFTELELKSILPALEYVFVLNQSHEIHSAYMLDVVRNELRKKYDAHLGQKGEQKKKETVQITCDFTGVEMKAFKEYHSYTWQTVGDPVARPEHKQLDAQPKLCDILFHYEYAKAAGTTLNDFIDCCIDTYAGSDAVMVHGREVEVTRLKSCKMRSAFLPCYALSIPEGKQPFSDAARLHSMYKQYKQLQGPLIFPSNSPYYSANCDSVRTYSEQGRKQGKTLQQEHAARVAHFEAEQQSKAASMGEMELDPKFCHNLLDGLHYLLRATPSHWQVNCLTQREYDFAIHSINQWAARCGKIVQWTFSSHYTYAVVGNNKVNLFKSWKHEGNIGQ